MSSVSRGDARDHFDELVAFLQRIEDIDTSELGIDLLLARLDEESAEDYDSVPHKASSASCFCGLSSVSKRLY